MNEDMQNLTKGLLFSDKLKSVASQNLNTNKPKQPEYLLDPRDPMGGAKYELGPMEEKALDPEWAKENPEAAALNYPGFSDAATRRRYNSFSNTVFRNVLQPYIFNPAGKALGFTTQFGPVGSTLATGGAGYLTGKLLDSLLNKAGINSRLDVLLGLLGAGTGYALGGMNKDSHNLRMKKHSPFYELGQSIGFVNANIKVSSGSVLSHKEEILKTPETYGYGIMQKNVCKLAADMYVFTGKSDKLEYHIFHKLANAKRWSNLLDPYVDSVYETLGKLKSASEFDINGAVKSSSTILNTLTGFLARGATLTPEALKALLGLSAVTGGSVGVATWLANRHAKEDETKNEILKQKINYYNQVTDELSDQLKSKGLIVSEEDPEAKDKQLV